MIIYLTDVTFRNIFIVLLISLKFVDLICPSADQIPNPLTEPKKCYSSKTDGGYTGGLSCRLEVDVDNQNSSPTRNEMGLISNYLKSVSS